MDLTNRQMYPDGQKFEALPNGLYLANIANIELKKTKDGSKDMFVVEFQVIEGPEGNPVPNAKNRKIFDNFVTTVDWRMGNLRELVISTGVEEEVLRVFDKNYPKIINHTVKIRLKKVAKNDGSGDMTNNVVPGEYYKYSGPAIPNFASEAAPNEVPSGSSLPFEM